MDLVEGGASVCMSMLRRDKVAVHDKFAPLPVVEEENLDLRGSTPNNLSPDRQTQSQVQISMMTTTTDAAESRKIRTGKVIEHLKAEVTFAQSPPAIEAMSDAQISNRVARTMQEKKRRSSLPDEAAGATLPRENTAIKSTL